MAGVRVPKHYFVTTGVGQSSETIHAGSYHHALKDAGIEAFNIMNYSSVLPAGAEEIEQKKGLKMLKFGAVLETIMARADYVDIGAGNKGVLSAAIAVGRLYRKDSGEVIGSFVAERAGQFTEQEARKKAEASLFELYNDGYCEDYGLEGIQVYSDSTKNLANYATVIVALCFVDYE